MFNPHFILVFAVRMASCLRGIKLYENYAFYGALARFSHLQIGEITKSPGIDDLPLKAQSFLFGQECGEKIHKHLAEYEDEKIFQCQALLANKLLLKPIPNHIMESSREKEKLENDLENILRALVKRAQIRTHTAKPGGEDIHGWLKSYYSLLKDYEEGLPAFVRAVIKPNLKISQGFFSLKDPIIALALKGPNPKPGELDFALGDEPETVFGNILKEIALY